MDMRPSAIIANVKGIKCDNVKCDYEDMEVKYEDYPKYVNLECPNCGDNLLTEEDYNSVKSFVDMAKMLDKEIRDYKEEVNITQDNKDYIKVSQELDGTGKKDIKVSQVKKEDFEVEDFRDIQEYGREDG